jgi:hypothetical protein
MKKLTFILFLLVTMLAIVSCPDAPSGPNNPEGSNGSNSNEVVTRKFWAQNSASSPPTFYQLDADRLASNSICEIWAERGSGVNTATANIVADAYKIVYTKMMPAFGYTVDVQVGSTVKNMNTMEIAHYLATDKTSGAKLTILLLDIKDGYTPEVGSYVGGYFHAVNLLKNDPSDPSFKSNELDMIYLDTYPSVPGSPDSNGTLAHEMQHLMNFVTSFVLIANKKRTTVMDLWIDEGLSSAAEWIYSGEHPKGRWEYYNEDKSGLIKEGNNFFIWNNHKDNPLANLDDYATVYLFFQYLRLHANNSNKIYYDIHTSTSSDYQAVTTAASINASHNKWPTLLRDWHAANFTNATTGLYGYKNETDLKTVKAPMLPGGTTTVNLFPGEGVYSKTTTAESVPAPTVYIKYAGLNSGSGIPNETTGFANGARLTYNVNTDINGGAVTGDTTGIAPSPSIGISTPVGSSSVQIASNKLSGPFKVDMSYFNRGNADSGVSDNIIRSMFNRNNSGSNSRSAGKSDITVKFDLSTLERVHIDE